MLRFVYETLGVNLISASFFSSLFYFAISYIAVLFRLYALITLISIDIFSISTFFQAVLLQFVVFFLRLSTKPSGTIEQSTKKRKVSIYVILPLCESDPAVEREKYPAPYHKRLY